MSALPFGYGPAAETPPEDEHECGTDDSVCPECCEHDDIGDFTCLICGDDRTEDLMAEAFDRAKDFAKYG